MKSIIAILLTLFAVGNAVELTAENYDELTAGKTIFKMKPDWDKLMDAFADSETALVADVDCTAEGKDLCTNHGIRGYPTLKYGDPADLQDYKGGRDYASLEKFATESLKPMCSPANLDLCEDDKKASIEKFLAMASDELEKLIADGEKQIEDAEEEFKTGVEGLQKAYQEMMEKKEKTQEEIKNSGLGLMKACKVHASKTKGSDEL
eukprot:jgi/Psemu1/317739/estExt_fgenesh1_pm.C_260001